MLKINGFEIDVVQGGSYDYKVFFREGKEMWREAYEGINTNGYVQVQFPKWTGVKTCGLHKIIYAFCMNWGQLDIMPGQHVHHLDKNPLNNDIENLIYIPRKMHERLHMVLNKMEKPKSPEEFYEAQAEASSIINKGTAVRDNRIKKCGRVPDKLGSLAGTVEEHLMDAAEEIAYWKAVKAAHKSKKAKKEN